MATYTEYRNDDGSGAEVTGFAYTWFSGTTAMQSMTATAPTILAAQNGPDSPDVTTTIYNTYGQAIWTRDGDGFLDYTAYDIATGAVIETIADVDTSTITAPDGWVTPSGGGLNLIDEENVDALGRTIKDTDPDGNVTYTVYDDPDHEVRTYSGWNSATETPTGPTEVTRDDQANGYVETLTMSATPYLTTDGVPNGMEPIGNIQSLERDYTDNSGDLIESDQYFSFSNLTYATTPHLGTVGTNYYATTNAYDDSGRLARTVDAAGTITDTVYDSLGRPVSTYVGTNDSTTDDELYTGDNAGSSSNMVLVTRDQYDDDEVGDGNLTSETEYPDSNPADARVTDYVYDGRDRLVATKSGVQASEDSTTGRPIVFNTLDNLGEVTAVSEYDGDGIALSTTPPAASLLRAYTVTAYDDQGRPYQVQQFSVDPTTGAVSSAALTTSYWYDHRGDQIAEADPGGQVTKDQYDGAGRLVAESITDGAGGSSWAAAGSLSGDHVLSETLTTYDFDGNPILVTTKDRDNTDTSSDTGALGDVTTGPEARVSYVASYYDAADRLIASADYGTNGGAAFERPSSVPDRSDTVLVTSDQYNDAGEVGQTTDPKGIVTQTYYDLLGDPTQVIDAYDPSINGGQPTSSNNQTTNTTYDGLGDTLTVTAVMPVGSPSPSQTTKYVYGVTTADGSTINSNDLLATLANPDPTTGNASTSPSNQTSDTYDALGETTTETDPTGTTHTYSYDVLGRQTSDAVTTLGSGVDSSVRRITTAYDSAGNPSFFTSYDAPSGGNVVNQVERVYNGLDQLTGEYQANNGNARRYDHHAGGPI